MGDALYWSDEAAWAVAFPLAVGTLSAGLRFPLVSACHHFHNRHETTAESRSTFLIDV